MVSEENRNGLLITVPLYFAFLAFAAYWAYKRIETMKHDGVSDKLTAHYLGGRDFGPLLTAGTLFASLFSGYTVIGVPNEAFRIGWNSIRWIPTLFAIVAGYFGTGLRLRKTSLIRNHQSPVDFITDRYQSQLLRYSVVFLQVLPTVIYLAAQVIAIKGTFNSIFELDPNASYPVIVIMILILIFEWVGGLNSVALTDSIQALIMVLSFVVIPSVILKNFGGWNDLDYETFPKPEFYQSLSKESQFDFWQFSIINFSFFTLPHLMQRTYAAKDLQSLKVGYGVMTIGPWFTSFVGIFMGTVGVSMLYNEETGELANPANPFSAILEEIMNLGGFAKGAGVIAVTASLAAIMSTADSLIIAISQLVTVEIVYPLRPNSTPTEIGLVGKFVSLISVVVALVVGLFWDEGISDLGKIQFALSAQAVPAFIFGLFSYNKKTDIHPWSIALGAISATIFIFGFFFGYMKPNAGETKPIDTGMAGFLLQLAAILVLESLRRVFGMARTDSIVADDDKEQQQQSKSNSLLLFPNRPQWDIPKLSRFGDHSLSPQLVWKSMEGINEPLTNPSWCFLMFFSISMVTPLTSESDPPLNADGTFLFPPAVYNGLPWWAFKAILLCIVPTVLLLIAIFNMPNQFPVNEKKIETEGIDPDLVEMTREELGRRTSYDEQNVLIHRRRSSISQTMDELGFTKSELLEMSLRSTASTPSQRRLSALVTRANSTRASFDVSAPLAKVNEADDNKESDDPEDVMESSPSTRRESEGLQATVPNGSEP